MSMDRWMVAVTVTTTRAKSDRTRDVATGWPVIMPWSRRTPDIGLRRMDGPVAQLDRAFGYEPKGREFESLRGHP